MALARARNQGQLRKEDIVASTNKSKTILVIGGNGEVRKSFVTVLKSLDFNVSGRHALMNATALDERVDLLITLGNMPGNSGSHLANIRNLPRPAIHVTLPYDDQLASNDGLAVIQETFVPVKLLRTITAILRTADKSRRSRFFRETIHVEKADGLFPDPQHS